MIFGKYILNKNELDKKNRENEVKINNLKLSVLEKEAEINLLKSEKDKFLSENKILYKRIDLLEEEVKNKEINISTLTTDVNRLNEFVLILERTSSSLKEDNIELENKINLLENEKTEIESYIDGITHEGAATYIIEKIRSIKDDLLLQKENLESSLYDQIEANEKEYKEEIKKLKKLLEEECDKNQDIKVSFNDLIKKNNELCEADASKSEEITKCSDYISKLESAIVDLHESIKSKDKEIEKHNDDLININEKVKELISVNKKLLESNKENEKVISEINDIGIEKKLFLMSISELNSKIEKNKDLLNLTKNQLKDNPICLSEEEAIKIIEVLSDENDIYHTLEEKIKKFKDFKYGITTSEKYTYNDACPACGSRSARCRCTD